MHILSASEGTGEPRKRGCCWFGLEFEKLLRLCRFVRIADETHGQLWLLEDSRLLLTVPNALVHNSLISGSWMVSCTSTTRVAWARRCDRVRGGPTQPATLPLFFMERGTIVRDLTAVMPRGTSPCLGPEAQVQNPWSMARTSIVAMPMVIDRRDAMWLPGAIGLVFPLCPARKLIFPIVACISECSLVHLTRAAPDGRASDISPSHGAAARSGQALCCRRTERVSRSDAPACPACNLLVSPRAIAWFPTVNRKVQIVYLRHLQKHHGL